MDNIAIKFQNVTKSYLISRMKYGRFSDDFGIFLGKLIGKNRHKTLQRETLLAINDLSFTVHEGECLGIIGRNGSGKSTILKLISKITYPKSGQITVNGKVGAFIELGAGLHPELSGKENIFLYGAILGMKKQEIKGKYADIVKFSGIEKFIDTPIKRYSSGMYARIGFSVVSFMDPEILLIDEVLAVGDQNFQKKCLDKMKRFVKSGKTIVFVSHNMDAVKLICSKAIYLDGGKIKMQGETKTVISHYLDDVKGSKNESQ
ncbi:hypothetical protein A3D81_01255 [Candidatus Curtissbacteria bacterium RIFCSPHIGHO2_02_FULL_40_17]|uniref:ABC transporter domain-containing protein n=3 Tax=Candidatus Curtissiibacteriota TaxID=1752717 RepID=A0A1F5GHS4_9BACT|nr:MAG: hypothetical protein A3D81_01255 [Candidatus Curtissbacteria bacterium RIFCSPHIGHO2_02_FULL_40_17]OGE04064.1 MAG: hypothetical protein A3F45_02940 [Candidatus Curtissbacteria bacterium RIFCSPHIGHO2_12_FULL_41_17]OGE08617.1 MAG: hypothetical protein A3I53_02510 [Candidatus Curtissbacteria bacterium RIFCSPLOWO2_02_FULL_40_13b]